jgi:GNAT superfamily N-acetyltransferase
MPVKLPETASNDRPRLPRQVRKARLADIPRLVQLRSAVRENILSDPSRVTTANYRWFIDNSTVWMWVEDEQIVGFSAGDPRDGTIWALFVDPSREGRGIAQALLPLACAQLCRCLNHPAGAWLCCRERHCLLHGGSYLRGLPFALWTAHHCGQAPERVIVHSSFVTYARGPRSGCQHTGSRMTISCTSSVSRNCKREASHRRGFAKVKP